MQRHATTLRRFWQTHSGLTRGDAIVAALFLAGTAGIALAWKSHIHEVRQHRQEELQQQQGRQEQAAQQEQQQRAAQRHEPQAQVLPTAAVAATAQP